MDDHKRLIQLIYHLVIKLSQNISRTKLVKLLYMIDFTSLERRHKKITNLSYNYYYYGPFTQEITSIIQEMKGNEIVESENVLSDGNICYTYLEGTNPTVEKGLSFFAPDEQSVINDVIVNYGGLPLKEFLRIVYETAPVKDNPPGKLNIL